MKKKDFIKYGEFVFGILLEFEKRHQLRNDGNNKILFFCFSFIVDLIKTKNIKLKILYSFEIIFFQRINALQIILKSFAIVLFGNELLCIFNNIYLNKSNININQKDY